MMDRRIFLKLTGFAAAAGALGAFPAAASAAPFGPTEVAPVQGLVSAPRLKVTRLAMREAGEYQVTGRIRLEAPTVEISGIANSQQISWSGSSEQFVTITSFESYDGRGLAPELTVNGGRLESLSVTPISWE
jgi:hypothetical protein